MEPPEWTSAMRACRLKDSLTKTKNICTTLIIYLKFRRLLGGISRNFDRDSQIKNTIFSSQTKTHFEDPENRKLMPKIIYLKRPEKRNYWDL